MHFIVLFKFLENDVISFISFESNPSCLHFIKGYYFRADVGVTVTICQHAGEMEKHKIS